MWYAKVLAKTFVSVYLVMLMIILVGGLPYSIYINKLDDYLKIIAPFSTAIAGVIAMYQWKHNHDYKNRFRENIMIRRIDAYEKVMDLLSALDVYVSSNDIQIFYFFINNDNRKDIINKIAYAKAVSMWLDQDSINFLDVYNKAVFSAFQYISLDDEDSLKLYLQLLSKREIDDSFVRKKENEIHELASKIKCNIEDGSNLDVAKGMIMSPYLIPYIKHTRRELLSSLSDVHQIEKFFYKS